MPSYVAVDEALIHASPEVVFRALLDECNGASDWWAPSVRVTPVSDPPFDHVGAEARSAVRDRGITVRFLWRIIAIEPDSLIRIEYAEGDITGIGTLTLTPAEGGTLLRYDWAARTNTWRAALLAPVLGMAARHSAVMRRGFAGLDAYVIAQATATQPESSERSRG